MSLRLPGGVDRLSQWFDPDDAEDLKRIRKECRDAIAEDKSHYYDLHGYGAKEILLLFDLVVDECLKVVRLTGRGSGDYDGWSYRKDVLRAMRKLKEGKKK